MIATPLRVVSHSMPNARTNNVRPRGSARVVIVDDRSTARRLLEGLARTLEPGVVVESYDNPQDALAENSLLN